MYLSSEEKDVVSILKDAESNRDARDKMLNYFNANERKMFDCTKSLGVKGFLTYVEINSQGQRETSLKITYIDTDKCLTHSTK